MGSKLGGLERKDRVLMPTNGLKRLMGANYGQVESMKKLGLIDYVADMSGKKVFITGANSGIGFETAKKLCEFGADVTIGCRRPSAGLEAVDRIKKEFPDSKVELQEIDLANLESIGRCASDLEKKDEKFDVVVLNAAISPSKYAVNEQGVEIAYATNVVGNYAVMKQFLNHGVLNTDEDSRSRFIVVTGDIYYTEKDCTSDFKYFNGILPGSRAYSRSKLGLNWVTMEIQKDNPNVDFVLLHPGVFDSNLVVFSAWLKKRIMASSELGAKMSIYCSCVPSVVNVNEGYYHNTYGLAWFAKGDPIWNAKRSKAVYEECQELSKL